MARAAKVTQGHWGWSPARTPRHPEPHPSLISSASASVPVPMCVKSGPLLTRAPRPQDPVKFPPWPQPWGPGPAPLRTSPPALPLGQALDFYRPCSCLGSPPPGLSTCRSCTPRLVRLTSSGPRMPAPTLPFERFALCLAPSARHRTLWVRTPASPSALLECQARGAGISSLLVTVRQLFFS